MSRIYLNDGWLFEENYTEKLSDADYQSESALQVRLPHTCKETPLHYFDESIYQMVCGYRKALDVPEEWNQKSVLLTLEGAAHSAWVYLNGELIGEHHCGYTAFSIDVSGKLLFGQKNILVIKTDSREQQNIPPFGYVIDYMTFGGIYRDVYLDVRSRVHIAEQYVQTHISAGSLAAAKDSIVPEAELETELTVAGLNRYDDLSAYSIRRILTDDLGKQREIADTALDKQIAEYAEGTAGASETAGELRVKWKDMLQSVRLWSVEQPRLYILETQLLQNGETIAASSAGLWQCSGGGDAQAMPVLPDGRAKIDSNQVRFGFRSAVFRADGFYFNGGKLKLRGLNRHQSYPYVGYAMPESMQRQDADILKHELGCNAVRTSHYPQSHYFIDRCDELGLLVFMEIPGWQHIGDEQWKEQAVQNVRDMIRQYRNHTSVILWGVRINESVDDEAFYRRTNEAAHAFHDGRCTGGVRAIKKSQLLEDVYTYNDFVHDGQSRGCEPKSKVTSDMRKAYLVSEYNGHMYPTKPFDSEEHRVEHMLRHANVLDAIAGETDIAGSFGWCMFDYNTHKDFGSGDRVCYHGVTDMFRNEKLAAAVYACQQEETPVLKISSAMDIGEHPAGNRGLIYILTNADSVRMYKNDVFIKEYRSSDSAYKNLRHGPILIDDFIGQEIRDNEGYKPRQAELVKYALNYAALYGYGHLPAKVAAMAAECMLVYRMKPDDVVSLYEKYVGNWGVTATVYRFEAIRDGRVVKTVIKEPMRSAHLTVSVSHTTLRETHSYDVAEVRIRAVDDHENLLYFYQEPVSLSVEGPIALIGPDTVSLSGGMGGVYVKTTGRSGAARLHMKDRQAGEVTVDFIVEKDEK